MSKTKIQWAQNADGSAGETWNPTLGCSPAKGSEQGGCKHCYAQRSVHVRAGNPNAKIRAANEGLTVITSNGPVWNGVVRTLPDRLDVPLRKRKPTTWFVNSLSDLFHESLQWSWIEQVFDVMQEAHWHTFQVLSKRADNLQEFAEYWAFHHNGPLPNTWLGVSVEDQKNKYRIDILRKAPAAVRFVSFEPLLEDLGVIDLKGIDLAIWGGESGPGARPCDVAWIRDGMKQAERDGCKNFVKQLGAHPIGVRDAWCDVCNMGLAVPRKYHGLDCVGQGITDKKGGLLKEFPPDLQVRQMPEVTR